MMKLYGTWRSRAGRCLLTLEELGLAYEQIPVSAQAGTAKTPEYLAINPSGKVPTLDDGGFVLRESLAICLHLVSKAATPLWPDDIRIRSQITQWMSWAATDLDQPLGSIVLERRRAAGADLDPGFVADRMNAARRALDLLEGRLSANRCVASDDFTLGDLFASATVALVPALFELAPYPAIVEWLSRCTTRPAWKRAEARP